MITTIRDDITIDHAFIRTFRSVTSIFIQANPTMTLLNGMTFDEFWPIDDASSLKNWCSIHIDAMGEDAADMIHPAITNALGISVTIIFLSRQDGTFKY